MPPFWAILAETLPRAVMGTVMGMVNALGNLGGWAGQWATGWLADKYNHSTGVPFVVLGIGMVICSGLSPACCRKSAKPAYGCGHKSRGSSRSRPGRMNEIFFNHAHP